LRSPGQYPSTQAGPPTALIEEIEGWINIVEEHEDELPEVESTAANPVAFRAYKEFYTDISKRMTTYTKTERHEYYFFLNKYSEGRSKAAKEVIDEAKKTAKLFERYQKKPANYSWVDSSTRLQELLTSLTNLYDRCVRY
jgi:hypothetical protein